MTSLWAALGLLSNALAWGVSWWPFRQLQDMGLHPLWATAFIYLSAIVVLVATHASGWRDFAKHPGLWALLIASGLTNVGFNWAVTVGDVVRVVLLFYLMPAWVVLLAWPILGERPTRGSLVRLALALLGVVMVLKTPEAPWPWPRDAADLLAIMGGFAFALTNIMLRKLHGTVPERTTMLAMFGGGAVMATLAALVGMSQGVVTPLPALALDWTMWVAGLSVVILIGNVGMQYGAARLSASATSIIMLSEILFASGSSVWMGASELALHTLAGGALIMAAAVWSAAAD